MASSPTCSRCRPPQQRHEPPRRTKPSGRVRLGHFWCRTKRNDSIPIRRRPSLRIHDRSAGDREIKKLCREEPEGKFQFERVSLPGRRLLIPLFQNCLSSTFKKACVRTCVLVLSDALPCPSRPESDKTWSNFRSFSTARSLDTRYLINLRTIVTWLQSNEAIF